AKALLLLNCKRRTNVRHSASTAMKSTASSPSRADEERRNVRIPMGDIVLDGELWLPPSAPGVVLFAHGSGSSRHSPRNQFVAGVIREAGLGTLLFDLLTREEEAVDDRTRELRFDISLLAGRLVAATRWAAAQPGTGGLKVGYFG